MIQLLIVRAQEDSLSSKQHKSILQDDPANFITRIELFNELMQLQNGAYLNVSTARGVMALGKRFTTRIDIPFVYNTTQLGNNTHSGIGDLSIRLLGYKFFESKNTALLASLELSGNTAQSPLLGTGKNILIPVVNYSWRIPKQKTILSFSAQQFITLSGSETRKEIQKTKFQIYYIKGWTKNIWTLVLPEIFIDEMKSDVSMNIESTVYYKFTGRFGIWIKGGVGLFGDNIERYKWTAETGLRYLIMRKHEK